VVRIDGRPVVDGEREASGMVELTAGPHSVDIRYSWGGGLPRLEWFWTPPNGERNIVPPTVLTPLRRSAPPDEVPGAPLGVIEPPVVEPVDLSAERVLGSDAGLREPRGVALDAEGNVYVGDHGNGRVVVFSPEGRLLRTFGRPVAPENAAAPLPGEIGEIRDIAVGPDGTVYVLEFRGVVQAFDRQGNLLRVMGPESLGMYVPSGIGAGSDGSLYIADTARSRVLRITPDGVPTLNLVGDNSGQPSQLRLEQPVDALPVLRGGEEPVYTIDLRDRIVELAPDGTLRRQWAVFVGRVPAAGKLAAGPDGSRIYLAVPEEKRVVVLDLDDSSMFYFGGQGQFGQPTGIAVDGEGRVYVVDGLKNNVQVFSVPGGR
jgi:DNA-binding beta-propeller fold protein YncE